MELIEIEMRKLWDDTKKVLPNLRNISVEMTSYFDGIYGYILFDIPGGKITTVSWEGMNNLRAIIAKETALRNGKEILFRNFKGVLHG